MNGKQSIADAGLLQRLSEGWSELWRKARGALTSFKPADEERDVDEARVEARGGDALPATRQLNRWGLVPVEVESSDDEVFVRVEAPGLEPENLSVEVIDDRLYVRGEKRAERSGSRGRYYFSERAYGRFERVVQLPCPVDSDKAKAKYDKGVLQLRIPRTEKPRRIAITSR